MREFDTGATRGSEEAKYDYEGFISPSVLERYAAYMHTHRTQADGHSRDSDNWQKGMSQSSYIKSLVRHTMDFWRVCRGGEAIDIESGLPVTKEELACAILFNIMGWLHEELKDGR